MTGFPVTYSKFFLGKICIFKTFLQIYNLNDKSDSFNYIKGLDFRSLSHKRFCIVFRFMLLQKNTQYLI